MTHIWEMVLRLRADVELPIGLVLALIVTVHVLLTKEDVTAAVGWIGLAWFSPFLGGFAYVVLGVNRVQRRARRLRGHPEGAAHGSRQAPKPSGEDEHLRPLRRGVGFLTARRIESGNSIAVLHNGDEAYPAMLAAIDAAEHSVGLATYIFRDDTIGGRFIEALSRARERGVEVRSIVDGIGSGWLTSPAYFALRRAGLRCERFMHSTLPWRMPFLNLRMHTKILVVDGRIGFTGGVNISDQNVLADRPADAVQDTHFRIEGPVVGQIAEVFARDWSFVTDDEQLEGEAWFPPFGAQDQGGEAAARVVTAGPDQDIEKVEFTVLQAIACARASVKVMTPYFLPDHQLVTALSLAAMRGVAVEIVLPEKCDRRMIDWAMHANVGPLLHDGVKIWRSPEPFRHSKVMVVDGEWCLIGSSNWDVRSFRLNFETCVEVYDNALAATLEALMQDAKGRRLEEDELKARSLPVRIRDAAIRLMLPYL